MHEKKIKDKEQILFLLVSLSKFYKSLVQLILARKNTLHLNEVEKSLKKRQQIIGINKSPKEN